MSLPLVAVIPAVPTFFCVCQGVQDRQAPDSVGEDVVKNENKRCLVLAYARDELCFQRGRSRGSGATSISAAMFSMASSPPAAGQATRPR